MIIQRIHNFLKSLLTKERSPQKLALALSIGVYIGFSPFICLHTLMAALIAWVGGLNFGVIWIGSHLINNPWTMMPVYGADYLFGNWLLQHVLGLDALTLNPVWMAPINNFLMAHTGLRLSFWSFLIGGNVLGLVVGTLMYPLLKRLLIRLALVGQEVVT